MCSRNYTEAIQLGRSVVRKQISTEMQSKALDLFYFQKITSYSFTFLWPWRASYSLNCSKYKNRNDKAISSDQE